MLRNEHTMLLMVASALVLVGSGSPAPAQMPTTTSLTSSTNPAAVEEPVTFTAQVDYGTQSASPGGTVTFDFLHPLERIIRTAALSENPSTAIVVVALPHEGLWQVTAHYGGDDDYSPSSSALLSQQVVHRASSASLRFEPLAYVDSEVPVEALVEESGTAGRGPLTPVGEVTLTIEEANFETTLPLEEKGSGEAHAIFTLRDLGEGSHSIIASYSGSDNHLPSTSGVGELVIERRKTSLARFEVSDEEPTAGQSVAFTVWVADETGTGPYPVLPPEGAVDFTEGEDVLGTAILLPEGGSSSYSVASFTTDTLGCGDHSVRAEYRGSDWHEPGVSSALVVDVLPTTPVADAGSDVAVHPGDAAILIGSSSSDPGQLYPLSYEWQLLEVPAGSAATLEGADTVAATLNTDLLGDYLVQLVVSNSCGAASPPDPLLVSTFNTAPIADAGEDRALLELGIPYALDGSQSYDEDGDPFEFLWAVAERPTASAATLDDPDSSSPSFVPDLYGTYVFRLTVVDIFAAASEEDLVSLSFSNVRPVANAGESRSVFIGDSVGLDGWGSSDANADPLTFLWSLVSVPVGSLATLDDTASAQPSFVADEPGTYVVSLTVNDGLLDSEPDNLMVTASSNVGAAVFVLHDLIGETNLTPPESFRNRNLGRTLVNKLNAVLALIEEEDYAQARDKLHDDVLGKIDGCESGQPDRNDWVTDCDDQARLRPLIAEVLNLLQL